MVTQVSDTHRTVTDGPEPERADNVLRAIHAFANGAAVLAYGTDDIVLYCSVAPPWDPSMLIPQVYYLQTGRASSPSNGSGKAYSKIRRMCRRTTACICGNARLLLVVSFKED